MKTLAFKIAGLRFQVPAFCHFGLASTVLLASAIFAAAATDLTIQMLTEFQFAGTGPQYPYGRLVQGTNGDFYGTTFNGGISNRGTVFKITSSGTVSTLLSFVGTNGSYPTYGGLMLAMDGDFYGNTYIGGISNSGTIFRISHAGVFTNLFSFRKTNGSSPNGWLAQGLDGNFYGTTFGGGSNNQGTIYRMTSDGALSTLFFFNGTNGANPYAGLVGGNNGSFYGTTFYGGSNDLGTVFKITTNGTFTLLTSFTGTNGSRVGANPLAGLVLGSDGRLYGTTEYGGPADLGTVFNITTNGVFSNLFSFSQTNGADPQSSLVEGLDGKFYGTTYSGGPGSNGTAFRITSTGVLETLVFFDYTNGPGPVGSLALANDGNFYGTTLYGGYDGVGEIFRLVTPPIVTAIIAADGNVTITWTSFSNGIYRVEYKSNANATSWTPLAPNVSASGNTASKVDTPGSPERYYRITLLP